jgi:hypothetical protein
MPRPGGRGVFAAYGAVAAWLEQHPSTRHRVVIKTDDALVIDIDTIRGDALCHRRRALEDGIVFRKLKMRAWFPAHSFDIYIDDRIRALHS